MTFSDSHVLELDVEASYDHLEKFANLVEESAHRMGMSEDEEVDLMIAVMEAVNNAILHGNKEDDQKRVWMKIETSESEMMVWVQDEGAGFQRDLLPNPLSEENLMKESGRGILMMQAFMDEIDFSQNEKGLLVTMKKVFQTKEKKG